jgi:hypothetical protein
VTTWLPFTSGVVSFIFALLVLRRYTLRRDPPYLLWSFGLALYATTGFSESVYGAFGWNPLVFRLWYLAGAVLVAAWVGQGTVYLLAPRRWAHASLAVLVAASIFGAVRVFGADLDPGRMVVGIYTGIELSGHAIVTPGVRTITPFFNLYGTLTLVGGAAYSAWRDWRRRTSLHRTLGNMMIAGGALLPAFGGTLSRFGVPGALYLTELLGIVLMFAGFFRTEDLIPSPASEDPALVEARVRVKNRRRRRGAGGGRE